MVSLLIGSFRFAPHCKPGQVPDGQLSIFLTLAIRSSPSVIPNALPFIGTPCVLHARIRSMRMSIERTSDDSGSFQHGDTEDASFLKGSGRDKDGGMLYRHGVWGVAYRWGATPYPS